MKHVWLIFNKIVGFSRTRYSTWFLNNWSIIHWSSRQHWKQNWKNFHFFLIFQIKVLNFIKLQYIWAILYSFEHCKSYFNWHLNKCSYLEPITVVLIKFALWHINGTIAKFFIQWFRHRFFWKILLRSKYCMPKIPFFKFFVSLYHSFSKNIEWLHLNTSTTDYFVVVSAKHFTIHYHICCPFCINHTTVWVV